MTSPSESASAEHVPGSYFDGVHSAAIPVVVAVQAGQVVVVGVGVDRRSPIASVTISESLGATPRVIRYPDGAFCEVTDVAALTRLLSAHGRQDGRVTQWEGSLRWIVVSGTLLLALLVVAYRYGIPALAAVAADYVPQTIVDTVSEQTMKLADSQVFEPTALDVTRQTRVTERFRQLRPPTGRFAGSYRILFRKSELLGPNAMALPSGELVVTDALVALAVDDDEVVSVLAHEVGHVEHRHGLRLVFQNSVVALAFTWFVGDMSTLLAAAPAALLQAKYSRELERDADAYAVSLLRGNDIDIEHLAKMLERLDAAMREKQGGMELAVLDYLSSHPVTSERLDALRDASGD